jgi:hypothetical protein
MYAEDRFFNGGEGYDPPQIHSGTDMRRVTYILANVNFSLFAFAAFTMLLAHHFAACLVYLALTVLFAYASLGQNNLAMHRNFLGPI